MLASIAFAEAWRQHQNPHLIANYCVQQQRKDAEKGNAVTHLRILMRNLDRLKILVWDSWQVL